MEYDCHRFLPAAARNLRSTCRISILAEMTKAKQSGGPPLVLLSIEDRQTRLLLATMLEGFGYAVEDEDRLDSVESIGPLAVVSDGRDATEPANNSIPVIVYPPSGPADSAGEAETPEHRLLAILSELARQGE
ncbi:MAG: hypothetical protein D6806_02295 [Deltaproteobacteria bacterium]|nr:MAG: hypothetical protein D6806_02295 [Deltaproteobacteria bacterium]